MTTTNNNNPNSLPVSELTITCKIWDKEVYELVDYYNTKNTKTRITINSSGTLSREDKKVYFTPGENQERGESDLLIVNKDAETGKYSVNCGTWSKDLNKLIDQDAAFIVYRGVSLKDDKNNYSSRYYKLNQGDIIKIGRIYFKILDIHAIKNKDRTGLGLKIKDESTFKGDNINSIIINGQEVIKGIYKKNGDNKKPDNHYQSGRAIQMQNSFFKMEDSVQNNSKYSEETVKFNCKQNDGEIFSLKRRTQKKDKDKEKEKFKEKKKNKNKISEKKEGDITNNSNIKSNNKLCRICYGEDSTEENPLIYPCICSGSMKYIHYDCLKNWLNSKIEEDISVDSENPEVEVISYNRKDISCELCKEKLPDYIKYNNRYYNISFYNPKFKEFIVLESMRADKHRAKFIHIMSFDNKESVHIGRANECELSIAELSVSRFHCIIHKDDGDMFLEDNTSKFGTLVLVQNNNLKISDSLPLNLQISKTFVKVKVPKMEGCSFFCFKEPPAVEQSKLNYQIQNSKGLDTLSYFIIKENKDELKEKEEENNEIENINKKRDLIDEDNKEKTSEDLVVTTEKNDKDLIDKDKENEENLEDKDKNKENEEIKIEDDNKSINSENILSHTTKIKRISIKKEEVENGMIKNNLSTIIDKNKNNDNINNNGQTKIVNIIKIKKQNNNNYDKTNANPVTTVNQNIYNALLENNNKIEDKKDE